MHFAPENIELFREIFSGSYELIRSFKGCEYLALLNNKQDDCQFSTLSHWESEEALEQYRCSDLFKTTWAKTKVLFDQKPEANSFEFCRLKSTTEI